MDAATVEAVDNWTPSLFEASTEDGFANAIKNPATAEKQLAASNLYSVSAAEYQ